MAVEGTQGFEHTRSLSHGLPMRMMLCELRCIRGEEKYLQAIADSLFEPGDPDTPSAPFNTAGAALLHRRLQEKLHLREAAYLKLEHTKEMISMTVRLETAVPSYLEDLERACSNADKPLKRMLHALRGNALTFSGGGIRSASFSLGVLQGLARFSLESPGQNQPDTNAISKQLLRDTQYVSTVSGGGYLGCWFSSWIARLASQNVESGRRPDDQQFRQAYDTALNGLAGRLPQTSGDPSPETVRHLREFTSYLAPQLGFSLDVWNLVAIVARNLLINWLMLAPLLLILVSLPVLLVFWLRDARDLVNGNVLFFFLLILGLIAVSAFYSGRALPSYRPWVGAPPSPKVQSISTGGVFIRFILPLLTVCFFLSAHFYPGAMPPLPSGGDAAMLAIVGALGFGILGAFKWWTHFAVYPGGQIADTAPMKPWMAAVLILFIAVSLGAGTGVGLELVGTRVLPLIARLHIPKVLCIVEPVNYVIFSVPIFLAVLTGGSALFSALTGMLETEEDREWWSRAGGALIACGLIWTLSTTLALYGTPTYPYFQGNWFMRYFPSISGGFLGILTSFIAKSSKTTAGTRLERSAPKSPLQSLLLPALAVASLVLIAVALARASEALRTHWYGDALADHPAMAIALLLVFFAVIGTAVNILVSINIFSLHGLYRERLMRAFLGASNAARHSDAFTDFDGSDTLLMTQLARSPGVPLHIVNTTLNLVGTRRAEWRQRKAESFTFSSISAGAWRLNYVASDKFGGDYGVSVATAMAISGAAANPNMGYHSSPLVTILMTLFNVRLGWWLPNPRFPLDRHYNSTKREEFWRRSSPRFSVWPLLQELFGLTDDTRGYIELSDGGHFEDLGLYEMVMRRCKNIIVVDAGADPTFHYEDLGNALRKIEIDLGIPIEFPEKPTMRAGKDSMANPKNRYCAVANIRYSCVDGDILDDPHHEGCLAAMDGTLIYIKACLNGISEPMGVAEYALSHAQFPHEPTSNQFFNEAQFESYRSLGSHAVDCIGGRLGADWEQWIAAARRHIS